MTFKFELWGFRVAFGNDEEVRTHKRIEHLEHVVVKKVEDIKTLAVTVGQLAVNYDLLSVAIETLDNNQQKRDPQAVLDNAVEETEALSGAS